MEKFWLKKTGNKNKIAAHASNINLILLILVLALMTSISAFIIMGLSNENSRNLVRAYSIEASQSFYSYISQDLTLLRKASHSSGIAKWFADENDEAKRTAAFEEIMVYAEVLDGANFFFGIDESQNEYIIIGETAFEDFLPNDKLDPLNTDDKWYYECVDSPTDYVLNNDVEKFYNTWCLWINHKVTSDGNLVGVICSGLKIPELYQKVFNKYATNNFRGYIIDNQGIIQADNTANPIYYTERSHYIENEDSNTVFAAAMERYLSQIDGFFSDFSEPVVVKLSKGRFEYASISPIINTDWSIVVFYRDNIFSSLRNFLPLVIVIFAALFLYVAVGNALMRNLVFTPLGRLTQEISEGKSASRTLFGSNRDDEIGELARTILGSVNEQQHQRQLLHAVNTAAAVLLSTNSDDDFEASLQKGMGLLGICLGVDRAQIWRNEMIDGELCFVLNYQWLSDFGKQTASAPIFYTRRYSDTPKWDKRFSQNEKIINPVKELSEEDQEILRPFQIKSIILFPLHVQNQFWGFFSFDDCHSERAFTEDELDILSSGCLMIINALNRNTQTIQLQQAHERTQILLDTMPMACHLWTMDGNMYECNQESVKLFKAKDKQDYVDRFWQFSPEYQPDGVSSQEKAVSNLEKAFSEGRCTFEWMHQLQDGSPFPAEVTLVRIRFGDDDIVAAYARDLREYKQMMSEIEQRDSMLHIGNRAAAVLLASTNEEIFGTTIIEGMELMGHSVDVDRVYIWQNEKKDNKLYYTKRFEWTNNIGLSDSPIPVNTTFAYRDNPEWEKAFLSGININGPLCSLSPDSQNFLKKFNIKSILMIPLYLREQFWGFVGFDDCHNERYFSDDETNILRSVGLMMVSAIRRFTQEKQLLQAHERTKILLDAMPLSCQLWTRDGSLFDCNEEAVKLFRTKDKQDFLNRFWEFSPEYQSDGSASFDKAMFYLDRAFEDGRVIFEWMHQIPDGTKIPSEVTAVRLKFGEEDIVAAYARDLREYKKIMQDIERRDSLLNIVNDSATILLQSETNRFERDLHRCMDMIAGSLSIQCVAIWKNSFKDNELYCSQVCQWMGGDELPLDEIFTKNVSYSKKFPEWEETLSNGSCIHGLVSDRPQVEQAYLVPQGIKTIFIMPVFVQDEFWGFVGYYDCKMARAFSDNEQSILRSDGMVIANAYLRNEMTLNIYETATKLEAVIANYSGIIWSVNSSNTITLYDGLLLKKLDNKSPLAESKKLESFMNWENNSTIITNISRTFSDGPQDWITQIGDMIFHARSTPIFDEYGNVANIVGSFDDITELSRLQMDLEVALKEARRANAAKSSFLARMSHEMRTPLNAIIGLSELTIGSNKMDAECSSNIEKINNAGITLLSTVNHILDISKIEAGKFELIPVEYEISSMLNDSITQSLMYKGEKPIKFILDVDEKLPTRVFGDDLRVKQVINNLLSNAFKYTSEGTVELYAFCSRDNLIPENGDDMVWIIIRVRDTGIGIRSENLPNLFTDYGQVDTEYNRRIEGTGLGLAITKKIVEMMDGSITVESEYGKGSVFTAKLKQKAVGAAVIGAELADNLNNFRYSDQKRHRSSRMMRINLNYARVLVVDDVETNLDVTKGMLKPYGMQVDCLTSGKEAINAIRSEKTHYNAIFMDHMMPEMDGIEATRIIREEIGTEYARTIPIIALTANAIMGNEEIFLNKGFQAFISKPIELERLDAVIREWVRDKELERTYDEIIINGEMLPDVRSGGERRNIFDRRCGNDRRTLGEKIKGINYTKGIQRFSGDEESYLNVLRSFALNSRTLLDSIRNVTSDNLDEYYITIHGIKGASRGICAEQVGIMAEALEKAAKSGNIEFVMANNAVFIEDTEKLVNDLEGMFKIMAIDNPKPKRDKIDPEVLKKLMLACSNFEMDGVDAAMEEIELFEYGTDKELAVWLRDNVNDANFKQIKDKLDNTD